MNFTEVEREYLNLRFAYINGVGSYEDLKEYVQNHILQDKNGDEWKIELKTGLWLCYDNGADEWIEKEPPMNKGEDLVVSIDSPEPPVLPADKKAEVEANREKLTAEEQGADGKDKLHCSACGAEVNENDKFCRQCGAEVEIEEAKYCPSCGKEVDIDDNFCMNCGEKL